MPTGEPAIKVVILCGGVGTRLREETETRPKPMVEIGGKPILWHVMKTFAHYGHQEFILCLGYKEKAIKDYFLGYELLNNDFTVELGTGKVQVHNQHKERGWRVTLVDTGPDTMTGARVKKVEQFVDGDRFMLTYADGLTDLNINDLLKFHEAGNKIGTVTGVLHPSPYGELATKGDGVTSFREKPKSADSFINGGYFVFRREFFNYLTEDKGCVLEREPMERLVEDGELTMYAHKGFWRCMDTYRDMLDLNEQWDSGRPGWKVWE